MKATTLEAEQIMYQQAPAVPVRETPAESYYETRFEATCGTIWLELSSRGPAKFTRPLVQSLRAFQVDLESRIRAEIERSGESSIKYQVIASRVPGIFSLGGDLGYFREMIDKGDRGGLRAYARDCVDLVFSSATHGNLPLTTISLVQGSALGGGFEAALANNVVVAERGCKMGLPEIMFNMFPGMGAYQLLCRRLPPAQAERFILSGRTYSAEELHDMGLVDVLAEPGGGEEAVWDYIRSAHDKLHGRNAMRRAIQASDPLRYEDFEQIIDIWVEAAFGLSEKDLKTMEFLVRAQQRMRH